jgi:hypothetical protein
MYALIALKHGVYGMYVAGSKSFRPDIKKAAPNGKCCEGYVVPSMVRLMYQFVVCWNKGRLCWKIAKLFYFCHLKKLVRPETFGSSLAWNTLHFAHGVCLWVLCNFSELTVIVSLETSTKEINALKVIWWNILKNGDLED